MIRAHRVNATAQDDASLVIGWNIAPNLPYILRLLPGPASCGVLLYDEDNVLVASGAALAGTDQPCVLLPQTGQAISMVDAELGWHLLISTDGTESQRTIRINPSVDLPDEIHPIYADDDMGLARATAAIDEAAHYRDDVTVSCPLGIGAGLGDIVSVPVDGVPMVGQVESVTWTATPDGTLKQAVIRRHVAIAPEAVVEATPPTVADDTGTATHTTGTSGNVLTNDDTGLTVAAVNGLSGNVGLAVDGDNGGTFTIDTSGSWTFDPDGDFALLSGSETADTSVTYHASDGTAEAMATLTVTVSHANAAPVAADDTGETTADTTTGGNVLTNDTDADGNTLTIVKVAGSSASVGVAVAGSSGGLFTIGSDGSWTFDPNAEFDSLTEEDTATSVSYHVSDGIAEDEGVLTVTVIGASAASIVRIGGVGVVSTPSNIYEYRSVSIPTEWDLASGDLLIVYQALLTSTDIDMFLSGFAELVDIKSDDNYDANFSVHYKIVGETADTILTMPSYGSYRGVTYVEAWRGVDPDNPIDGSATAIGGNSCSPNSPLITPVTDGSVIISAGAYAHLAVPTAYTPPGGYEFIGELHSSDSANNVIGIVLATQPWTGGSVDPEAWAVSAINTKYASWCAATIALRPV